MRCPFCPVLLPDEPTLWQRIGPDFFGSPCFVGNVAACAECATACEHVSARPLRALIAQAGANIIAAFFADLAELLMQAIEIARESLLQEVSGLDPATIEQAPATAVEVNPFGIWPDGRWGEIAINLAGYQMWIQTVAGGAFSCLHTLKVCDCCAALAPLSQVDDLWLCGECIAPPDSAPSVLVEFEPCTETVEVLGLVELDDAGMVTVCPPLSAGA